MQPTNLVDVRDKIRFVSRMLAELAGDARLSLEGDLSRCQFPEAIVVSRDETDILKRSTAWPQQDFIVLQLTLPSADLILKQILAAGLKHAILHLQIERSGVIELAAYDNLAPECVVTGPGISRHLLTELKSLGIVRSFSSRAN